MPRVDRHRGRKPGRGKVGKPTKLTTTVHRQIIVALRNDAYRKHAAEAAGVSDDAVAEWIRRGNETGDEPYASFARAVARAQADAAVRSIKVITKAADAGDWKAAAWKLERKHPKLFGANVKLEHDAAPSIQEVLARAIPTLQAYYGTVPAASEQHAAGSDGDDADGTDPEPNKPA